ncbi:MAG: alpha/beta hydrolase-fold protein [Planctomycetota bacterium]|nr:alpha/beta hydrolase-fold protein [Planctomycetota bacterium]
MKPQPIWLAARRMMVMLVMLMPCILTLGETAHADYPYTDASLRQPNVPQGTVTKYRWTDSKIYPGTERDYWIYVPAQYGPEKPACVMIFQDGRDYVNEKGHSRVPTVFDNLIHQGEMPVTIGIFINPGVIPPAKPGTAPRSNRSFEYDSLGDRYTNFLIDEILPAVSEQYNLVDSANGRAVAGLSSGGICAFTVAWERPDHFSKVVSYIGSFTNIRGGHIYPALIRKTEAKPLRVFLQEGSNDLDNLHGNWPLANQQMSAALKFAGYDHRFVMGDGGHSGQHGGAILPDILRWIWRDYPGVKQETQQ